MNIDLTPLIQAGAPLVLSAAVAAIPIIGGFAVREFQKFTKIKLSDQQLAEVQHQLTEIKAAADQGANLAYSHLVTYGASVPVKNVALAVGANWVLKSVPDYLKANGVTPEHVAGMVETRLGGLLAADPTVTVASAAPATEAASAAPDPVPAIPVPATAAA